MEKKIDKTFSRAMNEINTLQKAFKAGGKFEKAVADIGGDIAWFNEVNEAFDNLYDALEEAHMGATGHLGMDEVAESQLTEGVLDSDDDDGFMARSQLYFLARDAIQLHGIIDDREDLEPWVQSKISQASQGIDAVRRYSEYNALKQEMPQDDDQELMAQANKPLTPTDAEWSKILQIPSRDSFDKMIKSSANESMIQRWDAIKESVDDALMDKVLAQIVKDVEYGDMTAIEELLDNVSERDLMAFLSEIEEAMNEYTSGAPASSIRPRARPTMTRSLRPMPRPKALKRIGGMPGGSTRGIDPKDNYSPEDLKRLLNQSESAVDEGTYGKKKKKKYYEDVDRDEVDELVLYADNDGQLYQTSTAPVQKNLSRKWKKGVYDHELAIKLWKYHADRAAKKYAQDFGGKVMSPDVRRAAAKEFADAWHAELKAGNMHEGKYKNDAQRKAVHAAKNESNVNEDNNPMHQKLVQMMKKSDDPERLLHKILSDFKDKSGIADHAREMYADVAIENGLHQDDDHDDIEERLYSEIMDESKSQGDAWYIEQDARRMAEKDGHDWASMPYGRKSVYRQKAADMRKGDDEDDLYEGMEFDEKRTDDLEVVAKDIFKNALAAAKKKVK